jgi:hypothetical protein
MDTLMPESLQKESGIVMLSLAILLLLTGA